MPKVEKMPVLAAPVPSLERDAPDLLRNAEPIAIGAWNAFALWTWMRRAIPTCLAVFLIGLCLCLALGALPFILKSLR
jgi:hypothetical protein